MAVSGARACRPALQFTALLKILVALNATDWEAEIWMGSPVYGSVSTRWPVSLSSRFTHHSSPMVYAELKTTLARKYVVNATRKGRPRWIEDWIDKLTGKKLQIDKNDLWMFVQAKERGFLDCTTDRRMKRIFDADPDVRLHIL